MPPGTGICHQVNLEFLSQTVWTAQVRGRATELAYPDTLVGTDSHTTMVNGLAVLGWGVGGIEAEAAMLGQPISMLIPEVIGFKLTGKLREGVTATDLVLTVTQMLRKKGVVGKFVEFYGPGLTDMTRRRPRHHRQHGAGIRRDLRLLPDRRADDRLSHDDEPHGRAHRARRGLCQGAGHVAHAETPDPVFTDTLELDLADVQPSLAGPKRPQDRVTLDTVEAPSSSAPWRRSSARPREIGKRVKVEDANFDLGHGDVVIAAITSCTNTSNPSVMIGAGLLARNAVAKGLKTKPWVKTSLAPGSQVVAEYLAKAGLQDDLDALGFNLVGFGCTTCIGNSGPLPANVSKAINDNDLVAVSVLSGNRNFEGRVNPDVRANYLASPPLVVAYALAGSMLVDLDEGAARHGQSDGKPVYLKDIWPSSREVQEFIDAHHHERIFATRYADVFTGDANWKEIDGRARPHLRVGHRFDLRAEPALFRGHDEGAEARHGHRRRAHPRPLPRFDHHRPHLAGRQHPGELAGRRIPAASTRSAVETSTSTARGAATTK